MLLKMNYYSHLTRKHEVGVHLSEWSDELWILRKGKEKNPYVCFLFLLMSVVSLHYIKVLKTLPGLTVLAQPLWGHQSLAMIPHPLQPLPQWCPSRTSLQLSTALHSHRPPLSWATCGSVSWSSLSSSSRMCRGALGLFWLPSTLPCFLTGVLGQALAARPCSASLMGTPWSSWCPDPRELLVSSAPWQSRKYSDIFFSLREILELKGWEVPSNALFFHQKL